MPARAPCRPAPSTVEKSTDTLPARRVPARTMLTRTEPAFSATAKFAAAAWRVPGWSFSLIVRVAVEGPPRTASSGGPSVNETVRSPTMSMLSKTGTLKVLWLTLAPNVNVPATGVKSRPATAVRAVAAYGTLNEVEGVPVRTAVTTAVVAVSRTPYVGALNCTTGSARTRSLAVAVAPPGCLAVTVDVPAPTAVARPVSPPIVATLGGTLVHVTTLVTSSDVPSARVAVARNCAVRPTRSSAEDGATARRVMSAGVTSITTVVDAVLKSLASAGSNVTCRVWRPIVSTVPAGGSYVYAPSTAPPLKMACAFSCAPPSGVPWAMSAGGGQLITGVACSTLSVADAVAAPW